MPSQSPLQIFETFDPQLLKLITDTNKLALAEGAIPRKYKYLIAMALDAAHGATDGVRALGPTGNERRRHQRRDCRGIESSSHDMWSRRHLHSCTSRL